MHSGSDVGSYGNRVIEINGHAGPGEILGMVLCIILWAAVVTALILVILHLVRRWRHPESGQGVWASRPAAPQAGGSPGGPEALRILEERYARGELGHEEYLERKGDLTSS
jgi:uncharacterized membrane protein